MQRLWTALADCPHDRFGSASRCWTRPVFGFRRLLLLRIRNAAGLAEAGCQARCRKANVTSERHFADDRDAHRCASFADALGGRPRRRGCGAALILPAAASLRSMKSLIELTRILRARPSRKLTSSPALRSSYPRVFPQPRICQATRGRTSNGSTFWLAAPG